MYPCHVTRAFLYLTLLALTGTASAQPDKTWKELTPKDGGFTVKMPGIPKESAQNVEAGGMKLEIKTYTLEITKELVYVIAYNQMPTNADKQSDEDKKKILDGAREGMLNNIKGTLLKETNITWTRTLAGIGNSMRCRARCSAAREPFWLGTACTRSWSWAPTRTC